MKIYVESISDTSVYAAEELRKNLKMLRPNHEDVGILFEKREDRKGFSLSLMQDAGLDTSDVPSTELDDLLYVDCDREGGLIAGGNKRSILLSVYEYLRRQGCIWLFPGPDGEHIPEIEELVPVKLRHRPSMRYRGQSSEGTLTNNTLLDAIEFLPKVGMNYFMIEFRIPTFYFRRHYTHEDNDMNRPPEPVSDALIKQWKRKAEAEITKRGLFFNDVGHGWAMDAIGIDSSLQDSDGDNELRVPPESRQYLALYNGERKLVYNVPNYTQFCMSNKQARRKFVLEVAEYAEVHSGANILMVSLGDAINRNCECETCIKKTPSDWFVVLLNEIDEELTERGIGTVISFSAYKDTIWAPKYEVIKNPSRFLLVFCPITRNYTVPLSPEKPGVKLPEFVLNHNEFPRTMELNLAGFLDWKRAYSGPSMAFEYHMWRHQYFDVGGMSLARLIYDDIHGYISHGFEGIDENSSQRSFFPTGFLFYTYARTMFDSSLRFEELRDEYFTRAFGDDGLLFADYLERLGDAFSNKYLEGYRSDAPDDNVYYAPSHIESLKSTKSIINEGRELIKKNYNMPHRLGTYSVRLLELHADYSEMLADVLIPKAAGDDAEAERRFKKMREEMGKREVYFERTYDHHLLFYSLREIMMRRTRSSEPVTY